MSFQPNTVNNFKNRLDKFWSDQELVYDYKADLTGIGNISLISLVTLLHYNYVHVFVSLYLGLHIFRNVNLSMFTLDTFFIS